MISLLTGSNAHADLEPDVLDQIADFAHEMCATIPLKGEKNNLELTGKARADLSSFLQNLADIGVKGAADFQISEYQGLLQKDIVKALSHSTNCKLQVWSDLKEHIVSNKLNKKKVDDEKYASNEDHANTFTARAKDLEKFNKVCTPSSFGAKSKIICSGNLCSVINHKIQNGDNYRSFDFDSDAVNLSYHQDTGFLCKVGRCIIEKTNGYKEVYWKNIPLYYQDSTCWHELQKIF